MPDPTLTRAVDHWIAQYLPVCETHVRRHGDQNFVRPEHVVEPRHLECVRSFTDAFVASYSGPFNDVEVPADMIDFAKLFCKPMLGKPRDPVLDAVIVGFVNHSGLRAGVRFGLRTVDLMDP